MGSLMEFLTYYFFSMRKRYRGERSGKEEIANPVEELYNVLGLFHMDGCSAVVKSMFSYFEIPRLQVQRSLVVVHCD